MNRTKKVHPALKHGGYSAAALLPGEDRTAFEKLRSDLFAEFSPTGALEEDIVSSMARLVWRKQNLLTFRLAELARQQHGKVQAQVTRDRYGTVPLQEIEDEMEQDTNTRAQEELGKVYELVEIGDVATPQHLVNELELEDRLDAMIERCLKRLLMVRGVKSIVPATTIGQAQKQLRSASWQPPDLGWCRGSVYFTDLQLSAAQEA
jgi:hypothetical protein